MKNYFSYENLWVFCATAVLSLVFWCFSPYQYIPIWVTAVLFFLCILFLWLALLFRSKTADAIEKELIEIVPVGIIELNGNRILLIKPNKLLFMGAFITIHQKDNDVEVYIATGRVSNIQSDGKIQVTIQSSCAITSKDIPSLVLKLGFSVNALENNQEDFQQ